MARLQTSRLCFHLTESANIVKLQKQVLPVAPLSVVNGQHPKAQLPVFNPDWRKCKIQVITCATTVMKGRYMEKFTARCMACGGKLFIKKT